MSRSRSAVLTAIALLTGCTSAQVVTTPAPAPDSGAHVRYATRSDPGRLTTVRLVSLDAEQMVFRRSAPGRSDWVADSVPTGAIEQLQVRLSRKSHAGRGALIGGGVGLLLGFVCAASTDDSWLAPSPGECIGLMPLGGAMYGVIIGAFSHRETWAVVTLPEAPSGAPAPRAVTTAPSAPR